MVSAQDVNNIVDIEEIARFLRLEPNSKGFVSCPRHVDKTPSLKLYQDTNSWHCFSCGAGSSVIDLYMFVTGLDFRTSFEQICELFDLDYKVENPTGLKQLKAKREHEDFEEKAIRQRHNYYMNKYLEAVSIMNQDYKPVDNWTEEYPDLVQAIEDKDKYYRKAYEARKEAEEHGISL